MKHIIWSNYNCDEEEFGYLDDERDNLDVKTNTIICIADLGRWNGRVQAYKEMGNNINNCLVSDTDYTEWYCDNYNFRGTGTHHDGTNYYVYRERKDNINDSQWNNFLDKIYYGKCTKQDISRYTKSLRPSIAKVYGW